MIEKEQEGQVAIYGKSEASLSRVWPLIIEVAEAAPFGWFFDRSNKAEEAKTQKFI